MSKRKSLQPWLDFFELLHTYEENGLLEVKPEKHEAYITTTALASLEGSRSGVDFGDNVTCGFDAVVVAARRIRAYAGWKSQQGKSYLNWHFALHVVLAKIPHDLIYTLLLTRKRHWWWPFSKLEHAEVVSYS